MSEIFHQAWFCSKLLDFFLETAKFAAEKNCCASRKDIKIGMLQLRQIGHSHIKLGVVMSK